MFLCQQHYKKTAGPICMKFSGKVWSDHGTTWLNFGSIRINGSAGQRSICLLSSAIAQRTGVNKSVSFARWQQGAGFVVPRTTACIAVVLRLCGPLKSLIGVHALLSAPTVQFLQLRHSGTEKFSRSVAAPEGQLMRPPALRTDG